MIPGFGPVRWLIRKFLPRGDGSNLRLLGESEVKDMGYNLSFGDRGRPGSCLHIELAKNILDVSATCKAMTSFAGVGIDLS